MQWQGRILKVDHLAASIPAADRKELRIGDRRQWYFTVTLEIPDVSTRSGSWSCGGIATTPNRSRSWSPTGPPGRWAEASGCLGIVGRARRRFLGTASSNSGLGDCQLRDFQGQHPAHWTWSTPAYSLLLGELQQGRATEGALQRLMTIGEACRAMDAGGPADDALVGDRAGDHLGASL